METVNNQIIQEKFNQIEDIKMDITFLDKMKKKIDPNRSIYQDVLRTINEEISILMYQKEKIYWETERLLKGDLLLTESDVQEILNDTKNNYSPVNPPANDIMSPVKQARIDSFKETQKGVASGAESLV